jgi:Flp pilus assembly protein TadG
MKRDMNQLRRRGAIAPLMAVLMLPLLGMLAFSIDVGYIVLVQTDLQNAADAAALAGAERLQGLYVQYYSPGLTATQQSAVLTQATTNVAPNTSTGAPGSPMYTAEQFSNYNKAGGVYISVLDSDVTFGYMGASGSYSTSYTAFPNTISVTTRRDGNANTPLSLFFGPVFNVSSENMTATARATIYAGDITTLKVIQGIDAHILPVALDVNIWKNFYSTGKSPDGNTYYASNGDPQLQVYPTNTNTPGSFGLIDVGPPQNNAPAFRNWIDTGETPNDIQYLLNNNLLPVSMTSPAAWKVGPGLKSTLLTNFQDEIGKPNLIPLFTPASTSPYTAATGNGQGATYAVVGFAGVAISQATGNGNNMNISVQPAANIDATSVIANPAPAGTTQSSFSTTATTFISAKLTN